MTYEGMIAETVRIHGHQDDLIPAYTARPLGAGPFPGVIVVHHMPGWDEWCKEVTRRFAHNGYNAICPDLHFRVGPGTHEERSNRVREAGGQNDEFVIGDLTAGETWLRDLPTANGRVGLIGFCSGGRVAYMASAKMPALDAAVDCWGGNVIAPPDRLTSNQPVPPIQMTPDIRVPLLGIFGNDDKNPDPDIVNQTEAELKKHNKEYEFHRYDGAGHGFFNWNGPAHRPEQAVDAWKKIFTFYAKHLSGERVAAGVR